MVLSPDVHLERESLEPKDGYGVKQVVNGVEVDEDGVKHVKQVECKDDQVLVEVAQMQYTNKVRVQLKLKVEVQLVEEVKHEVEVEIAIQVRVDS